MSETFVPSSDDKNKNIVVEFCKGTSCRKKCAEAIAALAERHSLSVENVLNGSSVLPIAGYEVSARTIGCLGACGRNPSARLVAEEMTYFRASSLEAIEQAVLDHSRGKVEA